MKLNLLPKTVDTAGRSRRALFGSLLLFILSLVAAVLMANESAARVARADEKLTEVKPLYDNVVKIATDADAMMARPQVREAVVNTELALAMNKANTLYPDAYDFVKPYIPRFFKITSLTATANDANTSTVNMVGSVKTAQQYADLMLALLRIPGALSVSRSGFSADDTIVPPLTAIDQNGRPRLESAGTIPDDALDRLQYFSNQSVPTGYLASGGYGLTEAGTTKTVRPGESQISVSVTIPRNLQVPNPRATIQSLGGAAPAAGAVPARVTPPPNPAPGAGDDR